MSDIQTLISRCRELGAEFISSSDGKLKVSAPALLPDELRAELKRRSAEVKELIRRENTPGSRPFLFRPLGQENNASWVDAWLPFLLWLMDAHREKYIGIMAADDTLCALEESGIVEGDEYEAACAELFWRFEEARRLRLRETVKVWLQ